MNRFRIQIHAVILLILGAVLLNGCTDDSEGVPSAPSISLSSDQGISNNKFTGYLGDTLHINVAINAPGGFNNLDILEDGVRDTLISRTAGQTQNSFTGKYDYVLKEVGDVTLTFKAVDDNSEVTTAFLTVTVEPNPTTYYKAKLLYAPAGDFSTATFFSTNDGMTYSKNDIEGTQSAISPKIDFGYYYGSNDKASLASPAAYPSIIYDLNAWTTQTSTKLKMTNLSVNDFTSHLNDINYINDVFANGTSGDNDEIVTQLQSGNILAFELDNLKGNKKGLIRILNIETGTEIDDYIEIEVIVVR